MRKRVFGVLLAAFLLVGALTGVASAVPQGEHPKHETVEVTCPEFQRGQGQEKAGVFTQRLPSKAHDPGEGTRTSLDKSAGGPQCETDPPLPEED